MRLLFLVAFVVIGANAASLFDNTLVQEWKTFKLKHQKNYGSLYQETLRMRIYAQNRIVIARHNQRFQRGLESFEMDVNRFSDLLAEEFRRTMLGFRPMGKTSQGAFSSEKFFEWIPPQDDVQLPSKVDWRDSGAVTRVKNQGQCGSYWAFSATGALESQWFLQHGKLMELSEQNLMDCSTINRGCDGGIPLFAYGDIMAAGGINLESDYPYQEHQNDQCKFNPSAVAATVKGIYSTPVSDEKALMKAVAINGPISVEIEVLDSFQHYSRGVYYDAKCSSEGLNLNHAVLIVGYGTASDGAKYWLVKNSWGEDWGDSGYIKMARNRNNNCGIASEAGYPVV